ncbi:hypothetical protein SNE40_003458 [Patella caerulea]|uniref:Uncharacterized protein n=1 Tax=Patella caerulea TaxID=87958 RepID=A0AAN8KBA1_PATCE
MKIIICTGLLAVLGIVTVYSSTCTDDAMVCQAAWNKTLPLIATNKTAKCDALVLEYECLRLTEKACIATDAANIQYILNNEVIPIMIIDCPEQLCKAEILGCVNQWKSNATAAGDNLPAKCRDAAAYEACLNGIQDSCTDQQRAQILATLNILRPQINKACKNEDCSVQINTCDTAWKAALAYTQKDLSRTCIANEGLEVCLERIEVECSPAEKVQLQQLLDDTIPTINSKCQGQGCAPKLFQCTDNWNMTIMGATDITQKCSADNKYETCLKAAQGLCNAEEKAAMDKALSEVGPYVTQHCGGGMDVKPWTITVLVMAGALLMKRYL